MSTPARTALLGVAAFALGGLAYPLGRSTLPPALESLGHVVAPVLPPALGLWLPDALWSMSAVLLLAAPWPSTSPGRLWWAWVGAASAVGWELAQGVGMAPGAFDPLDLVASAIAAAVGLLLLCRTQSPQPSTPPFSCATS